MTKKAWNNNTISKKLIIPVMIVVLMQALLYAAMLLFGGVIADVKSNSYDILNERVVNRRNYIQNEMIHRWSNLSESEAEIVENIQAILTQNGLSASDIQQNVDLNIEIVEKIAPNIIYMLRKNSVTGAFLILDGPGKKKDVAGPYSRAGIYLRDLDPSTNSVDDSDLLMERGLPSISKELGISLDSYWSAGFEFDTEESAPYFYRPLIAARENPDSQESSDYGYWYAGLNLDENDYYCISYSIPLVLEDGSVIGVLGIDLTTSYLRSQLNAEEISNYSSSSYLLCTISGNVAQPVVTDGSVYKKYYGSETTITFAEDEVHTGIHRFDSSKKELDSVYGSIQRFHLYDTNSPFEGDQWALIGITEENMLLSLSQRIQQFIFVTTGIALLFGIFGVYFASNQVTRPIKVLAANLASSDPKATLSLPKTNIREIDTLSEAIEKLSQNVADSASKLSKILAYAKVPLGVFEYERKSGLVFCSAAFAQIMNWEATENDHYLPIEEFQEKIQPLAQFETDKKDHIFRIPRLDGSEKWLQFVQINEESRTIGILSDITKDMLEKQKIEYERDYDVLTGLFNRRSFTASFAERFDEPQKLRTACLIMWDLDNLKYINDTYGHDWGDRYIQCLAECLKKFHEYGALVSRISGDKFYVFLSGFDSKEQIYAITDRIWQNTSNTRFALPDNPNFKLRVSAGMAWYPSDADSQEQLLKYADFAMYSVKHSTKGQIREFSKELYSEDSILINGQESLNDLIEKREVRYAFQPIVSAKTGDIYAYEALMRPQLSDLASPFDALRIAKAQAKLYHIETLTWFEGTSEFISLCERGLIGPDVKLFINSISSCRMTRADYAKFERQFAPYLNRIVMEITENEPYHETYTLTKSEILRKWGGMIAIDDFGSGYSNENTLLFITPHLVKVDMSIVRGVDQDADRLALLRNLLFYCKVRDIAVIAEGVETMGELKTLIAEGVDYLQGYYLGSPELEPKPISAQVLADIKSCQPNKETE